MRLPLGEDPRAAEVGSDLRPRTLRGALSCRTGGKVAPSHARSAELERGQWRNFLSRIPRHIGDHEMNESIVEKVAASLGLDPAEASVFDAMQAFDAFEKRITAATKTNLAGVIPWVKSRVASGGLVLSAREQSMCAEMGLDPAVYAASKNPKPGPKAPPRFTAPTPPVARAPIDSPEAIVSAGDADLLASSAVSAGIVSKDQQPALAEQLKGRTRAKARGLLQQLTSLKGK